MTCRCLEWEKCVAQQGVRWTVVTSWTLRLFSCLLVSVSARQLAPFKRIEWALQQIHPHALVAVFEPKLDVVAKSVALRNPAELDEIRADRLRFAGTEG